MADLSFQQVLDELPAGSFTETADDVTISLKTLMGETNVQLADTKVAEALSKLMKGASDGQVTYNAANPGAGLTSYPVFTSGIPTADSNGNYFATRSHNLTVRVPLNVSEITAVPQ